MFIGIEIGGTKLQLGLGAGDGHLQALWRGTVESGAGGEGIRRQIVAAIPELLAKANVPASLLQGVGIGFGGPIDDQTCRVIKSHQISGWDDFPLADWLGQALQLPTFLGNDADVAGLAEATWGAGRGFNPVLYMTIGSGIGGGLILNGDILRGTGRGAAEIGHLKVRDPNRPGELDTLENVTSGWGIRNRARQQAQINHAAAKELIELAGGIDKITAQTVGELARDNPFAAGILAHSHSALADAICAAIVLVCPQRVVIGGGVSLMGEELIFEPLRRLVAERVFTPFAGLTEIVPAQLGEEVVVHGALELAKKRTT
jgi:glucokinase